MMDVNQTPPDRMTVETRRQEVAQLLARGIARLKMPKSLLPGNPFPESEFELAIPPGRSVHEVSNPPKRKDIR